MARVAAQEKRTRAIRAEARPNVFLTAAVSGAAGGATPSSGDAAPGMGLLPLVPNWDAAVVLSWPLFDASITARAGVSRADERTRREEAESVRQKLSAAVVEAHLNAETARDALPVLRRALDAAVANYAQADARFRTGLGSAIELADAESLRTDAEIQLALGSFAYARARAALGRAIAEGSEQRPAPDRAPAGSPLSHRFRGTMAASASQHPLAPAPADRLRGGAAPFLIGAATLAVIALGGGMIWRAEAGTNKVALAQRPRSVTMVIARASMYQPSRTYVGVVRPWVEASVGPQLVAAYVETVHVRPGDVVKRGEVLATLDCRNAQTAMAAVAQKTHAIEKSERALSAQAARTSALLDGGFVSSNDVEQEVARSGVEAARLEAQKATLANSALEVSDCVLRAPFDGEIGERWIDPGAFVRPGTALVSVVDRAKVRFTADVPEVDFAVVPPARPVRLHLDATGRDVAGVVARRAPRADAETRTVHFEVDLEDPTRQIPVGTTGEVRIDVGEPLAASEIPLVAATVRGSRATVFTVEGDVARARTVPVLGELGPSLFVARALAPETLVVTQGRTVLHDGDRVDMTKGRPPADPAPAGSTAKDGAR